jgi:4-alpha-glucanotransferase
VRSSRNWGIGDFTDLRALLGWAGPVGAAAIGINPLHALYLDDPSHISPYSPSSRVFINPLYIDVEAVDDFAGSHEARILVGSVAFRQELERLRSAALVDYAGVAALKLRVLELLHRAFRARSSRDATVRKGFDAFRERHGVALDRFAVFQVLREVFGARDPSDRFWRRWPEEFQDPHSASVAAFARAHAERVEFFCYLQWQAELQLSRCVEAGHLAGLPIGLYLDLAVGTDTGGADSWADSDLVATGATIGAPPDTFHRLGQNWGLPPPNAGALRERAFQPFVDLLRANMRWAGALRIDHVLGLQRLFWIPEGATPAAGAYVAYPFDELIGLVALESHRNRCMVIGEDLGTLPEGFQAAMRSAGLLSYCLLFFERDPDGRFRSPQEYPMDALAAITTHDLPTLWGYWDCEDIDARASVGAFAGPADTERDRDARRRERAGLVDAFRREGLVGPDQGADSVPFEATLRFIARTPCRILMVGFEDLLGVREQANLPGTVHEYPNWRRKLPMTLEAIMSDRGVLASADVINAERPPVWRRGSGP